MSDSEFLSPPPSASPAERVPPAERHKDSPRARSVLATSGAGKIIRRPVLWVGLVAAAGLVLSALLWQKLGNMQEELARRSTDSSAQSIEARTLARQAQEATRDITARLALLENRVSEVSLQRTQLEELMQSLSRSRDENLVVDVESALRLAQQQAQLTGSAEPLLAALRSADQRLARAAQPRLNPLQRAIARDVERIKATTVTDVPGLLLKLDELTRGVDELPLANAMPSSPAVRLAPLAPAPSRAASSPTPRDWLDSARVLAWWQGALQDMREEVRSLLRVSRIDQPEAALLAPEQAFFLRENLKLKLLNARLGLLSRQSASARSDLASANAMLVKYFDMTARRSQVSAQLLEQVQSQMKSSELPRLDETLAALATAAAGR